MIVMYLSSPKITGVEMPSKSPERRHVYTWGYYSTLVSNSVRIRRFILLKNNAHLKKFSP